MTHLRFHQNTKLGVFGTGCRPDISVLPVEQQPPPKGKEYVHSMMYWMVIGNHALMIQSRSLTSKHLEEYLTWLLKDRTTTITPTGQVILQAKFDASDVGGDLNDIKEIVVGGKTGIHAATEAPQSLPLRKAIRKLRRKNLGDSGLWKFCAR
jgi:hypothetical protein